MTIVDKLHEIISEFIFPYIFQLYDIKNDLLILGSIFGLFS